MRREEADGVVAPVVREPLRRTSVVSCTNWCTGISSIAVTPSALRWSMIAGWAMPAYVPRISSGTSGVRHREALDVRLVDHGLVVLVLGVAVVAPVEVRVDHHREHRVAEAVVVVERVGLVEPVGEQRLVAVDLALDGLRVGVEQQLRPGCTGARRGVVGAVDAVAVALPGLRRRAGRRARRTRRSRSGRRGSPCRRSPIRHSSTRSATSENSAKLTPRRRTSHPAGTDVLARSASAGSSPCSTCCGARCVEG